METIIPGQNAFITEPLANITIKYVKWFKLLIRRENVSKETAFD